MKISEYIVLLQTIQTAEGDLKLVEKYQGIRSDSYEDIVHPTLDVAVDDDTEETVLVIQITEA